LTKNSQPFGKKCQKTSGWILLDSHCRLNLVYSASASSDTMALYKSIITKRRHTMFGHVVRLDATTPAHRALEQVVATKAVAGGHRIVPVLTGEDLLGVPGRPWYSRSAREPQPAGDRCDRVRRNVDTVESRHNGPQLSTRHDDGMTTDSSGNIVRRAEKSKETSLQNSHQSYSTSHPGRYIRDTLHWLPVTARIQFKIAALTFDCVRGTSPVYLKQVICPVSDLSRRSLRSATV